MVTSRYFDAFGADMRIDTEVQIVANDEDATNYIRISIQETLRLSRWLSQTLHCKL